MEVTVYWIAKFEDGFRGLISGPFPQHSDAIDSLITLRNQCWPSERVWRIVEQVITIKV